MSLEEFRKIDAKTLPVGKLIAMIAKANTIYLNHNLKHLDINASQLHLLFELSCQNNLNQEKIASRCNINKGAVARSIKKLEEKELIIRKIDDNNRRQNIVSLTPKGENTLRQSTEILNDLENKLLSDYSESDKELLQETLKDIVIRIMQTNEEWNGYE